MPSEETPRRVRSAIWWPVLLVVALLVLVFGLLRAQGANGPAVPEISSVRSPDDPTEERSAAFMFTDAQTVTFECSLDASPFTTCGDGVFGSKAYPGPLRLGRHTFAVRATAAGHVSAPASYEWTIVAQAHNDTDGNPDGSGSSGAQPSAGPASTSEPMPFDVSGSVEGLAPGITKTIVLTLRNPNADPIYVTSITVEISASSTPPGCASSANLSLRQATGITSANPVEVPAGGSVVLGSAPRAPELTFTDLPSNQDVCKDKTFALSYTGSAHS